MNNTSKTKQELIEEISFLKQRIKELEQSEVERMQIGKKLRESEDKFAVAFLKSAIPMAITTIREGRYTDVNEAFSKVMGLKREDLIGNTSTGIGYITPEQRALFLNELNKKGYVENLELLMRIRGGEARYGLFNSTRIKISDEDYLLTVVTDITEKKRTEEVLYQSREQFRAIADYTYDWETWIGPDGKVIWISPAVLRLTGYSAQECMVMKDFPLSIVYETDRGRITKHLEGALQGSSGNDVEFRICSKDGNLKWVSISWQTIHDEQGKNLGSRSSIRDITDRKLAKEELKKSEEKYRNIFVNAVEGIFRTTLEGCFISANPAVAHMLGYESPEELINTITDTGSQLYTNPEDRDTLIGLLSKHGFVKNFEVQCRHKNGSIIWGT
ncbi:MAG: hypothetical protein C0392_08000, partial [Syntrophus sp. (in: bacteria)]|nr:hypothetical protein [Syntrophus sp. (in: bacteria)]